MKIPNSHVRQFLLAAFALAAPAMGMAGPDTIRFQGRLTDNSGAPIVGNDVHIQIALFSVATGGGAVWQTSGEISVATNDAGLFATDVGPIPSTVFSAGTDLYLELHVRDTSGLKTLSPRQKLSTVPFAFRADSAATADSAASVADGSIGSAKIQDGAILNNHLAAGAVDSTVIKDGSVAIVDLSPAVQALTIPSGMIAMFAQACPSGWTRFAALDNRFPLGIATYTGNAGGSATITGLTTSVAGAHSHTVNAHTHGAGTLLAAASSAEQQCKNDSEGDVSPMTHTHVIVGQTAPASPGTDTQGNHTHTIISDGTWLPPYLGVVYCQKD